MKIINKTGNSVYIGDIDLNLPYSEEESPFFICADLIKKSTFLQNMISYGHLMIYDYDPKERIESNMKKFQEFTKFF